MEYTLNNGIVSVVVKSLGAELTSLKKNEVDFEYMWTGDSDFWGGQSPVLFPIVGSVKDEQTLIDGKKYELKNHGFARRNEFELSYKDDTKAVFSLRYSDSTLELYPYRFELRLIYTLSDSGLSITYEVENLDDKEIYFQLGTHPGFNCPMKNGLSLSDYILEFSEPESAKRYFCNNSNLIINDKEQTVLNNSKVLALSSDLFNDGALIFRDIKSESVTLKCVSDSTFVRVSWFNFPYLGIWQPKNAPFLCIEPWHGVGDNDTHSVEFKEKEQIVSLQPKGIFAAGITVEI